MEGKLEHFITWTKLKIRLHIRKNRLFFKEREIWWASLGVNIGFEQNGKHETFERPILVLKKFNHDILWIVPLTRQEKNNKYYFKLEQSDGQSFVILSQLRLISSNRLYRKMRTINQKEFLEIKKRIVKFLL